MQDVVSQIKKDLKKDLEAERYSARRLAKAAGVAPSTITRLISPEKKGRAGQPKRGPIADTLKKIDSAMRKLRQ